jgi:hypothetical protein
MKREWVSPLFVFAALYDIVLGLIYGLAFRPIYARFGIALPNHDGYVQLPAALILVFGVGFWFVARAPERNRDLIKLGIGMKAAFCAVVLGHYFLASIPAMWIPFALADLLFGIAFLMALRVVPAPGTRI